jgi:nucleoside-triphosphatase
MSGPKLGKYRVNLVDLKNIGVISILEAIKIADIIVIDEIGPTELYSLEFRDAVKQVIISKKSIIGTIHHRINDSLINTIKTKKNTEILEIALNNREIMPFFIVQQIINFFKKLSGYPKK